MTRTIGTIREFNTANFHVIVDAIPEDDLDLSFDDTGEVAVKLDDGTYIAFVARARVFLRGSEIGSDYLGNCIYKSLDAFQDHREVGKQNAEYERKGEAVRCGSQFRQMINSACSEARQRLSELCSVRVRKAVQS